MNQKLAAQQGSGKGPYGRVLTISDMFPVATVRVRFQEALALGPGLQITTSTRRLTGQ